jgi:streptogramin lyase
MVRRDVLAPVALAAVLVAMPQAGASSWSELRYGTRDGLPSPYVKAAAEDGAGFVWLATDGGLVRFDGATFTSYLDAPSGRFVKAVVSLPDGRVLVAGDSGVSVVSATARGARIEQLVPAGERPSPSLLHYPKGLFVDSHGRAWVSEVESVALLLGGPRFERFSFPPEARTTSFVRSFSLAEDDRGRIWAASRPGELFAFDEAARRFVPVPSPAHAPAQANTNHLAAVARDVLWQASDSGLVELRLAADRAAVRSARALEGFVAPSWIRRFGADVLVTSYSGPAQRVRPGSEAERAPVSSASVMQQAVFTRSGDLYLSTDDGLAVLRQRPFEALPLPAGELALNVQSFALGPGGVLYACDRRNVYRLERDGTSVRTVRELALPGALLMGLLGDSTRLAVAGLGRLLLVAGGRVTRTLDLSDRGTYVVGLAATSDGSAWIAQFDSQGALRLLPDGTLKAYGADAGLQGRIVALRIGKDGALYATGAGRASYLFRYDPARDAFANLSRPARFAPPEPFDVRDVEVDRAGRIWLASTAGLLQQDEGSVRRVDLGPELTGLPTHSLATTHDGRLWIATSTGLVGLQPERHAYEAYDESSGLPSKNIGFHGLFTSGDELLVATTRGIARALVSELLTPPAAAPVVVQLRANGSELELGGPDVLQVPHGAWIAARAASPGGGERSYQWKMEPVDADWRPPSARPEATSGCASPAPGTRAGGPACSSPPCSPPASRWDC